MTHMWKPVAEKDRLGVVIYNFDNTSPTSLKLFVGDTVHNLREGEDWYYGFSVQNRSLRGIYPKSFVHIVKSVIEKTANGEQVIFQGSPVIQEVTSTLREWGEIWRQSYVSRNPKFTRVRFLMVELLTHRSKLLSGTLTVDEQKDLQQLVTSRIDFGNNLLGLDMVVRDEAGNILNSELTSSIELHRQHELASQRIKKAVALSLNAASSQSKVKISNRHSHMLYVALRNFVCRLGEDAELLLLLHDARDWKPLTESYIVRWSKSGLAQDLDQLGNLRVVFTDLGSSDLSRERVYLVCYVVRVGNMELREDPKRSSQGIRKTLQTALLVQSSAFLRRPCGVAAMDITDFISGRVEADEDKHHFVPFVQCGDRESLDSALRRLIQGRDQTQKDRKGQGLWCSLRLLHGDLKQVSEEHPALIVGNLSVCRKLGFPEVILPGDVRHDLYLTLVYGEFSRGSKSADKNVEVTVQVCNEYGQAIPGVVHVGSGVEVQNEYRSVVYYHEDKPKWLETIKIALPPDEFYRSHLRFTYKHRSSSETKDRTEKPFALSFIRLMQDNGTTLNDDLHNLLVYKIDHKKFDDADTAYLKLPATRAAALLSDSSKPGVQGLAVNNKDSLQISTLCCSTKLTQNIELLGLLKYWSQPENLGNILTAFMKVDGEDVVKFLQDVLDALFNILMQNPDSDVYDILVFDCLVFVIGLVSDRKYQHFKPVLDVYITDNFSATLVYKKLLVVLKTYIDGASEADRENRDVLRVMKCLEYTFKFIVKSRQLFANLYDNEGSSQYDGLVKSVFQSMVTFLKLNSDYVVLAQGACLRYLPAAIPDLIQVTSETELSSMMNEVINAVHPSRITKQKLMTYNEIVHSQLFIKPDCRAILLPSILSSIKDLLSKSYEGSFGGLTVQLRNQQKSTKLAKLLGAQQPRLFSQIPFREETELCVKILCDLMQVLHRNDIGSVHNDIASIMMTLLRPVIKSIIMMERRDPLVGPLVAAMISVFRQMTPHHYRNFLGHFAERVDLLDFLIEILIVFKDLITRSVYPLDWAQMVLLQNSVVLKALRFFSHTIRDEFSNPFESQVWNNFFYCAVTFITQPALQLESFSQTKRRQILLKHRDMRREMAFEIRTMWFNLGQHKITFVPAMVGPFLEMTLVPETELRKATIPIFFDMMQCEFYSPRQQGEAYSDTKRDSSQIKACFTEVENAMISHLDVLVEGGRGDSHYKDLFSSLLGELCENHATMRDQGLKFVRTVTRLIERLLEYRSMILDENRENRMSCTVNLLDFYSEIGRQEMYIRYLNKLCDLHLECDNFTEAAYTLQLHAQLLQWNDELLPTLLRTSRHPQCSSHRQLKEALYLDSIGYFDRGRMWESAVALCKELAQQYEEETFDYTRLSALLNRMATLYDNIIKQIRPEPEYFRVAFYGRGFPAFLQNKVFVFRGKEYEHLSDFSNRILMQFPNAEVMSKLTPPGSEIKESPQQFLQINKVDPIMEDQERFSNRLVSEQILRFYRVNQVQQFSFSRPFHRGKRDSDNTFSSLWIERTILTTSYPLPGILRWFPVRQCRVFELSPLQNAIEQMESTNRQLTELILAHKADPTLSLHPLSMKLNGIVDAAVNGGITNYEKAFFHESYLEEHPQDEHLVYKLKDLFALQIPLLEVGLIVHRQRVSDSMLPLHQRIEQCFNQMRSHVEEKYGRRVADPQFERQMALLSRSVSRNSSDLNQTSPVRLSANSTDALEVSTTPASLSRQATQSMMSVNTGSSQRPLISTIRQTSATSLFSRGSFSHNSPLASLISLPSTPSTPSLSTTKMLGGTRFRDRSSKNAEKKQKPKETKHRDSMRRLSTSSVGKTTPFPWAFSLGSSSGPASPAVSNSSVQKNLGASVHSLDYLSEATNPMVTVSSQPETPTSPPGVIELTQKLTTKRPPRSSLLRRSINGSIGEGVSPSPSQNSIESCRSSSSDDLPPPLPVKQSAVEVSNSVSGDKLPIQPNGIDSNFDSIQPPPPPPKKPSRPLPPAGP